MAMVPRESWCRKSASLALGRRAVYALLEADVIPALRVGIPREFVLHRRVVLGKRLKENGMLVPPLTRPWPIRISLQEAPY